MAQLTNTVLNGKLVVNGNIYGNLIGNASTATSAANAVSLNGKAESALSVSYATTASTATNATNATSATKIATDAATSTSTYVLLGIVSSTAVQKPVRTGIEIVGTNINACTYTLNVGTIKGNYEVEGAVEQATYAVSAGYAGYALKLNNGSSDFSIGSSTLPVYFSGGIPVATSTTLAVSITGNAATATTANNATSLNSKAESALSVSHASTATSATSAGYTAKVSATSSTSKNYIIGAVSIGSSQSILANASIYVNSGNTVVAPTFSGAFSGNASSATYASRVVTTSKQTGSYHLTMVSASTSDTDGADLFVSNSKALTYNVSTGVVSATAFSGIIKPNTTNLDDKTDYYCALPFIDCTDGTSTDNKPIDTISPEVIHFSKSTSDDTPTFVLSLVTYSHVNSKMIAKEFVGTATKANGLSSSAGSASVPVYFNASGNATAVTSISKGLIPTDFFPQKIQTQYQTNTNFYGASYPIYAKWVTPDIAKWLVDGYETAAHYSQVLINSSYNKVDAGSSTLPVYFSGGVPVATSTTLGVSITGKASTAGTADISNTVKKTATSSNSTYYIPFVSGSTSAASASIYVGNSKAFTFNPSTGVVTATKFSGAFSGNATSATSATYATSLKVQNYTTSPGYLLAAVSSTGTSLPIYANTNIVYYPSISTLKTPSISVNNIIHNDSMELVIGNSSNEQYVRFIEDTVFDQGVDIDGSLRVGNKPVVTDAAAFGHKIHVLTSTEFAALSEKNTDTIYFITP